ncbi:hypothetical protein, partial [Stenotrophomonas muris]|uniref:hypothetical protein n=1 Tax=Stenotrophomonas muris TaxID=2963283 RepID=UPI00383BBE97
YVGARRILGVVGGGKVVVFGKRLFVLYLGQRFGFGVVEVYVFFLCQLWGVCSSLRGLIHNFNPNPGRML